MSLINDMLRDLDNRRKHEQQGKTFTEVPIAVKGKTSSQNRWWIFGTVFLFLGAVIWLIVLFLPLTSQDISEKMVSVQPNQEVEESSTPQPGKNDLSAQRPVEQQVEPASTTTVLENTEKVQEVKQALTRLLDVEVTESDQSATVFLHFSDLPEYRLEQGVPIEKQSKLVISFSEVELDGNLEIPELAGKLLTGISLRPQQKRLQLLVDLSAQSEVGSYELKGNNDRGYTLQIDIQQITPLISSTPKKPQIQKELPAEPAKEVESEPVKKTTEVASDTTQKDDISHLSRSTNRLSPDRQAYQSGLEQMRQGQFAIAERSFATALEINPANVQARVQLISALQQQNKMEQAQAQMREGLTHTPMSLQLRKMYSRYLLSKKLNHEAIEVLQTRPLPTVAQDPEYHALLAALLQETGQFNTAAQVYADLLQLRPETALWWFGFAVSVDQAGDFEQARNAYRRALALPGLSVDVQKYIHNRLQVL